MKSTCQNFWRAAQFNASALAATYHLRNILAYDRIRVEILPSYFDFFNDRNAIARLRK